MSDGPLRVLLVSCSATLGGAPRVLLDVAKYLSRDSQIEVQVALARHGPAARYFRDICPTHVFPENHFVPIPKTYRVQSLFYRPVRSRLLRAWYRRLVRKFRPHVIYDNTQYPPDLMECAKSSGVPVVAHVHSFFSVDFARGSSYLEKVATFADRYIAVSEFVRDGLESCLGIRAEKITTVYNGINLEEIERGRHAWVEDVRSKLGVGDTDLLIGGVGRTGFRKGVDLFVRAAARAQSMCPNSNLRFLWVGASTAKNDHYTRSVIEYASRAGLRGQISFIDFQENVYPYMDAMDIVVVPSREETLSLVAAEANYLGKPVVACPAGGLTEVMALGGGLLTRGFDAEEIATETARLVNDPGLRKELGEVGRQRIAEHFDSGKNLAQIRDVILGAANGVFTPSKVEKARAGVR